ncbi:Asp-tRNA(Asn)/Glu-tRNA(Gln) amidotransferase subunit GatC [Candidatus Daviesbacteria bacterium]|nr:Asp-tRNA(Asn)/Glu-tRNA(Gln) amidotransferase subunit GatC [Candidatus Daviesbacteria bacterium]
MKLTKVQIEHVAKLANLPLTEDEIKKYSEQLSKILEYVEQLNSVNTKNIDPTFNTTGLANITSEDTLSKSLTQEASLQNAPVKKNGFFVTKGVFNE